MINSKYYGPGGNGSSFNISILRGDPKPAIPSSTTNPTTGTTTTTTLRGDPPRPTTGGTTEPASTTGTTTGTATAVARPEVVLPGQPAYRQTAGTIKRTPTKPLQTVSMPGQPTYQKTAGTLGTYQQGRNWDANLSQIGKTINKAPAGGYRPRNQALQTVQTVAQDPTFSMPATQAPPASSLPTPRITDIGYTLPKLSAGQQMSDITASAQPIMSSVNAVNPSPVNLDYSPINRQENMIQNVEDKSVIDAPDDAGFRESNLAEGYDASYLKELAASQVDPLNEGFQEALRQAGADFNRMGLRGSGFEVGDKYGSQPGSITSKYLQEMGNVARDVSLKGAEAAREDRFRQSEANENARQNWSRFDLDREKTNFDNASGLFDMSSKIVDQDEDSQRYWSKDDLDRELASRDYRVKAVELGMRSDQENEANRQWFSNFNQQQKEFDDSTMMDRWKTSADLSKWDAERGDQAREFDSENDLKWADFQQEQAKTDDAALMDRWKTSTDLGKWDAERIEKGYEFDVGSQLETDKLNAEIKNAGITNMINFMTAQGATAADMQKAYWDSIKLGQGISDANVSNQASAGAMIKDLLFPSTVARK